MTSSEPVHPLHKDTHSAGHSNIISTMAELRLAAAAGAWPTRGLAVRAGVLVTNGAMSSLLLRCADGRYMRAARLWLQIASYLDDDDQLVAALRLAAECAKIGGNASFAHNCMGRAEAAERQRHIDSSVTEAAVS